ncbi:tyrosine-protein kinase domain-containing protein [Pelagibacterium lentulum]|uniref:Polysaccharide chain length determinant N-terminal domain-containing protein n=1 Tax=Pelagibacterium lentulum TaxID=2029865 RepID=A0A916W2D5_9HYPH|nr:tyrosine-protein kinase domain-containing protein [Pelagibacterium lentulum]GGA61411.1 hypothetical protein GCM10011499_34680 [Pelagibacterium lentulum]
MGHVEIDIRSTLGALRRQASAIAITFTLVVGIALAVLLAFPFQYQATALVLIDPKPQNLRASRLMGSSFANDDARVENEVEVLRSDPILIATIEQLGLLDDATFNAPAAWWLQIWPNYFPDRADNAATALEETLLRLRQNTEIERRGLSNVIAVTAKSPNRLQSRELANTIVQAYMDAQRDDEIADLLVARQVLESHLEEARQDLAASEKTVDDFMAGISLAFAPGIAQRAPEAQTGVQDRRLDNPPGDLTGLYRLQYRAQLARAYYQALITGSAQFDMQHDTQGAGVRLLAEALPPSPRFPDIVRGLGFAGLIGLGLGFGVAFKRERFHGGFTSARHLSAETGYTAIAEVPSFRPNGLTGTLTAADALVWAPLSRYSESIRRIRVGIDQTLRAPDGPTGCVIMMTSPNIGTGASSLALALARDYALSGAKTLLMDCDLRSPSQHKFVDIASNGNFHKHLRATWQSIEFMDLLVRDPHSSLSLLLNSDEARGPTDQLLSGRQFDRIIALARQTYDCVIIDTPAVGAVVDGLYLAKHADIAVVTIKWAQTRRTDVDDTLARLAAAKGPSAQIVTVLNRTGTMSTPADAFASPRQSDV